MLSNFIRRILGAANFPQKPEQLDQIEPQVYQPEPVKAPPAPPPATP
jgi:hypothetical protein